MEEEAVDNRGSSSVEGRMEVGAASVVISNGGGLSSRFAVKLVGEYERSGPGAAVPS